MYELNQQELSNIESDVNNEALSRTVDGSSNNQIATKLKNDSDAVKNRLDKKFGIEPSVTPDMDEETTLALDNGITKSEARKKIADNKSLLSGQLNTDSGINLPKQGGLTSPAVGSGYNTVPVTPSPSVTPSIDNRQLKYNDKTYDVVPISGNYDGDSFIIDQRSKKFGSRIGTDGKLITTTRAGQIDTPELKSPTGGLTEDGIRAAIQADNYIAGVDAPNMPEGETVTPENYKIYRKYMDEYIKERSKTGVGTEGKSGFSAFTNTDRSTGHFGRNLVEGLSSEMNGKTFTQYMIDKGLSDNKFVDQIGVGENTDYSGKNNRDYGVVDKAINTISGFASSYGGAFADNADIAAEIAQYAGRKAGVTDSRDGLWTKEERDKVANSITGYDPSHAQKAMKEVGKSLDHAFRDVEFGKIGTWKNLFDSESALDMYNAARNAFSSTESTAESLGFIAGSASGSIVKLPLVLMAKVLGKGSKSAIARVGNKAIARDVARKDIKAISLDKTLTKAEKRDKIKVIKNKNTALNTMFSNTKLANEASLAAHMTSEQIDEFKANNNNEDPTFWDVTRMFGVNFIFNAVPEIASAKYAMKNVTDAFGKIKPEVQKSVMRKFFDAGGHVALAGVTEMPQEFLQSLSETLNKTYNTSDYADKTVFDIINEGMSDARTEAMFGAAGGPHMSAPGFALQAGSIIKDGFNKSSEIRAENKEDKARREIVDIATGKSKKGKEVATEDVSTKMGIDIDNAIASAENGSINDAVQQLEKTKTELIGYIQNDGNAEDVLTKLEGAYAKVNKMQAEAMANGTQDQTTNSKSNNKRIEKLIKDGTDRSVVYSEAGNLGVSQRTVDDLYETRARSEELGNSDDKRVVNINSNIDTLSEITEGKNGNKRSDIIKVISADMKDIENDTDKLALKADDMESSIKDKINNVIVPKIDGESYTDTFKRKLDKFEADSWDEIKDGYEQYVQIGKGKHREYVKLSGSDVMKKIKADIDSIGKDVGDRTVVNEGIYKKINDNEKNLSALETRLSLDDIAIGTNDKGRDQAKTIVLQERASGKMTDLRTLKGNRKLKKDIQEARKKTTEELKKSYTGLNKKEANAEISYLIRKKKKAKSKEIKADIDKKIKKLRDELKLYDRDKKESDKLNSRINNNLSKSAKEAKKEIERLRSENTINGELSKEGRKAINQVKKDLENEIKSSRQALVDFSKIESEALKSQEDLLNSINRDDTNYENMDDINSAFKNFVDTVGENKDIVNEAAKGPDRDKRSDINSAGSTPDKKSVDSVKTNDELSKSDGSVNKDEVNNAGKEPAVSNSDIFGKDATVSASKDDISGSSNDLSPTSEDRKAVNSSQNKDEIKPKKDNVNNDSKKDKTSSDKGAKDAIHAIDDANIDGEKDKKISEMTEEEFMSYVRSNPREARRMIQKTTIESIKRQKDDILNSANIAIKEDRDNDRKSEIAVITSKNNEKIKSIKDDADAQILALIDDVDLTGVTERIADNYYKLDNDPKYELVEGKDNPERDDLISEIEDDIAIVEETNHNISEIKKSASEEISTLAPDTDELKKRFIETSAAGREGSKVTSESRINSAFKGNKDTIDELSSTPELDPSKYIKVNGKKANTIFSEDLPSGLEKLANNAAKLLHSTIADEGKLPTFGAIMAVQDPASMLLYRKDKEKMHYSIDPKQALILEAIGDQFMVVNASSLIYNDIESVKRMLSIDKGESLNSAQLKLTEKGQFASEHIRTLGRQAMREMGISIDKSIATEEQLINLEASYGYKVLQIQQAKGNIEFNDGEKGVLKKEEAKKIFPEVSGDLQDILMIQITPKFKTKNEKRKRRLLEGLSKGENASRIELLDLTDESRDVSNIPVPEVNTKIKNTKNATAVGRENRTALRSMQTDENQIDMDVVNNIIDLVNEDIDGFLVFAGMKTAEELDAMPHDDRLSAIDKNKVLAREVSYLLEKKSEIDDKVKSLGITEDEANRIWFTYFQSKSGRLFINSNKMNPQTGKASRFVTIGKDNIVNDMSIEPSSTTEQGRTHAMSVAQGLGIAIDKGDPKQIEEHVKTGVDIINRLSGDKKTRDEIVDAFKKGNKYDLEIDGKTVQLENEHWTHVMSTMMDLDRRDEAIKKGNKTYVSKLTMESDGVTNGVAIGETQSPGGAELNDILMRLKRSNIVITSDNKPAGYDKDNDDSYQSAAREGAKATQEALEKDTTKEGELVSSIADNVISANEDGSIDYVINAITKFGRDLVKYPLMTSSYGAMINTVVSNIGKEIVEKAPVHLLEVVDQVVATTTNKSKSDSINKSLENLIDKKGYKLARTLLGNAPTRLDLLRLQEDLRNKSFLEMKLHDYGNKNTGINEVNDNTKISKVLSDKASELYGKPIGESIRKQFQHRIKGNRVVTNALKNMFHLFDETLSDHIEKAIKDNDGAKLTISEEDKIFNYVAAKIFPSFAGPDGRTFEDNLKGGGTKEKQDGFIEFLDSDKDYSSGSSASGAQATVNKELYGGSSSKSLSAKRNKLYAAISSGAVLPTQTTDGNLMAKSRNRSGKSFINVFDAMVGAGSALRSNIKAYNTEFMEVIAGYNLNEAVLEAYAKALSNSDRSVIDRVDAKNEKIRKKTDSDRRKNGNGVDDREAIREATREAMGLGSGKNSKDQKTSANKMDQATSPIRFAVDEYTTKEQRNTSSYISSKEILNDLKELTIENNSMKKEIFDNYSFSVGQMKFLPETNFEYKAGSIEVNAQSDESINGYKFDELANKEGLEYQDIVIISKKRADAEEQQLSDISDFITSDETAGDIFEKLVSSLAVTDEANDKDMTPVLIKAISDRINGVSGISLRKNTKTESYITTGITSPFSKLAKNAEKYIDNKYKKATNNKKDDKIDNNKDDKNKTINGTEHDVEIEDNPCVGENC